ncbi:MAG: hypothetical protein L3J56_06965 [Bacteroidales bacterium]|nr:hypothetical protein [Bacteroidales bacterium]
MDDKEKDILLDDNNDLIFQTGDFVIGESEKQDIKMILQAVKNDYKQTPEIGVNLIEYINNSQDGRALKQAIKLNLRIDGKENKRFKIDKGEIVFYE